jgi:hypothetical protein
MNHRAGPEAEAGLKKLETVSVASQPAVKTRPGRVGDKNMHPAWYKYEVIEEK